MDDGELKVWFYNTYLYCDGKFDECHALLRHWVIRREESITSLEAIVDQLNVNNKNTNISSVVGSSAGAAGGTLAFTGLILAPVTAGTSLILTASSLAVVGAGALTRIGSKITNNVFTKRRCKEAQAIVNDDVELSVQLRRILSDVFMFCREFLKMLEENELLSKALELVQNTDGGVQAILKLKSWLFLARLAKEMQDAEGSEVISTFEIDPILVGRMSKALLMTATTGMLAARTTLGLLGIGLDIWDIVTTSKELKKGSKSEAMQKIVQVVDEMKKELESVSKLKEFVEEAMSDKSDNSKPLLVAGAESVCPNYGKNEVA